MISIGIKLSIFVVLLCVSVTHQLDQRKRPELPRNMQEKFDQMRKEMKGKGQTFGESGKQRDEREDKERDRRLEETLQQMKDGMSEADREKALETLDDVIKNEDFDIGKLSSNDQNTIAVELNKLDRDMRQRVERMATDPGNLTKEDMEEMPIAMLRGMNKEKRKNFIKKITSDVKRELCKRLQNDRSASDLIEEVVGADLPCNGTNKDDPEANKENVKRINCGRLKDKKERGESMTQEDVKESIRMPECLGAKDLLELPPKDLEDNADTILDNDEISEKDRKNVLNKLMERFGDLKSASKAQIKTVAKHIKYKSPKEISRMEGDAIFENAEEFCCAKGADHKRKLALDKIVYKELAKVPANNRSEQIIKAARCLLRAKGKDRKNLNLSEEEEVAIIEEDDDCDGDDDDDDASRDRQAKTILKSSKLKLGGKMPKETQSKVKNLFCSFPPEKIEEKVDADELWKNLNTTKLKKCPKHQKETLFDLIIKEALNNASVGEITCEDFMKLKKFVSVMNKEQQDKWAECDLDDDDENDDDDDDDEDDDEKELKGEIRMRVFKKQNEGKDKFDDKVFKLKSDIKKLAISPQDFKLKMNWGHVMRNKNVTLQIAPTRSQAKAAFEALIGEKPFPMWTTDVWAKIAVIISAAPLEDIREDEVDPDLREQLQILSTHFDDYREEQLQAWANKVKTFFNLDDEGSSDTVEELDAELIGPFWAMISDIFHKLDRMVVRKIFQRITRRRLLNISLKQCTFLAEEYLKYVENDNGEVIDISSKAAFSPDDIAEMGNLSCCISVSIAGRLTKEAWEQYGERFLCIRDPEVEKRLSERVKELNPDWSEKSEQLSQMSNLLVSEDKPDMTAVNEDALVEAGLSILTGIEKSNEQRKELDDKGFGSETTDTQDEAREQNTKVVVTQIVNEKQESEKVTRRRKRATTPKTCIDMKGAQELVTYLPKEEFSNMADQEFLNCLDHFGTKSEWSTAHLQTLATKAKSALGAISGWTSANAIQRAGSIVGGLSKDEIAQLPLDLSALAAIGKHNVFSSEQLKAGFARWLSREKNGAGSIVADELVRMKNFVCGATAQHIQSLTNDAYSDASAAIGKITSCSSSQAERYAEKAKSVWGNTVSTWAHSYIATLGSMVAGLTGSELGSLNNQQIEAIEPIHIGLIPANKFKFFSTTQLEHFSLNQANSVTQTQRQQMSEDQRKIVNQRAGIPQDNTTQPSGAAHLTTACFLVAMTTLLSMLF